MPAAMYAALPAKCPLFCHILTKIGMCRQVLVKLPCFICYENRFDSS
jgi:hypothetical protein